MKAIVVRNYGGPEVLKLEDYPDPVPGSGEVLVRVAASSVNPADVKQRAGLMKDFFPINFPGLVGLDVSGTVAGLGPGVEGFALGDKVFALAGFAYAELCVVKASDLAHLPAGIDLIAAAALPLVTTTGNQLISRGAEVKPGQTVLVTGAAGNVGRSAVFTARTRGAKVIAGVLKKQLQQAASLGADLVIATDDAAAWGSIPPLDAVADTVNGKTAENLMAKVKPGGVFASVLGPPKNAGDYPQVKVVPVYAQADAGVLVTMGEAVRDGKLVIPIACRLPLKDADQAHAAVEKGGIGKVLLVVSQP